MERRNPMLRDLSLVEEHILSLERRLDTEHRTLLDFIARGSSSRVVSERIDLLQEVLETMRERRLLLLRATDPREPTSND